MKKQNKVIIRNLAIFLILGVAIYFVYTSFSQSYGLGHPITVSSASIISETPQATRIAFTFSTPQQTQFGIEFPAGSNIPIDFTARDERSSLSSQPNLGEMRTDFNVIAYSIPSPSLPWPVTINPNTGNPYGGSANVENFTAICYVRDNGEYQGQRKVESVCRIKGNIVCPTGANIYLCSPTIPAEWEIDFEIPKTGIECLQNSQCASNVCSNNVCIENVTLPLPNMTNPEPPSNPSQPNNPNIPPSSGSPVSPTSSQGLILSFLIGLVVVVLALVFYFTRKR